MGSTGFPLLLPPLQAVRGLWQKEISRFIRLSRHDIKPEGRQYFQWYSQDALKCPNFDQFHILFCRFSFQLKIRTLASSGLIYYTAHQKQIDYAALQLQEGKLRFSFDLGKGQSIVSHGAMISDGKWHTVHFLNSYIQLPRYINVLVHLTLKGGKFY